MARYDRYHDVTRYWTGSGIDRIYDGELGPGWMGARGRYRRYDRDYGPDWTGGGRWAGAGYRKQGYFSRPRHDHDLFAGPGAFPEAGRVRYPVYDRGFRPRSPFRP
ncbi:MAG TPA: hypothetical protein VFL93_06620 [Longimicrobiaceae bacterium]|nr:hypothetical protein [Longimicrobiaceae bacterium]